MVSGRVHQINISQGGVPKFPVAEARVTEEGIVGDYHNDVRNHGGPQAALCLFTLEQIERLRAEGHPIAPGTTGENVTLAGIALERLTPGTRLWLGDQVEIEITHYTTPCKNITASFSDGDFTRIAQKLHPGESRVYARVLTPGTLLVGAQARVAPDPR
ncbi:MAG TPA: MOSC domain-containing protein [Ktedonobacterales bacterium]|nr:MOSC domain-containing protein [Ktedonobacterales bacterium]